jgi:hypothetical protein
MHLNDHTIPWKLQDFLKSCRILLKIAGKVQKYKSENEK